MKKIIFLVLVTSIFLISACQPDVETIDFEPVVPQDQELDLPDVVASINGEIISSAEVLNIQSQLTMQGMPSSLEDSLNQVFTQRVLLQEAESRYPNIGSGDVLSSFEAQGLSESEVRELVSEQGVDFDLFLEDQVRNLKFQSLVDELSQNVVVSEEEIRNFYDTQGQFFGENDTFDLVRSDIEFFLVQEQTNDLLINLAQDLIDNSEIELFI